MNEKEILKELKLIVQNYELLQELKNIVNNDKWITIKPHGQDSSDYRRLKLKDGETPKEAIERQYGGHNPEKKK